MTNIGGCRIGILPEYGIKTLVLAEPHETIEDAIRREKALKTWKRAWKIELIEQANPDWADLFDSIP